MLIENVISGTDFFATGVFAITGALAAAEQRNDIMGFVLFGTITGVGGGTIRDLLLGADAVFWLHHTEYLWICIFAAVATWFLAPQFKSLHKALIWADAVGLALFSVLGANKAIELGAPAIVAVGMGVMTPTFGSMIRDTLLNLEPVLLGPQIYVSAALAGAVTHALLIHLGVTVFSALCIGIGVAFLVRASAILFDLRLPKYSGKGWFK